MPFRLTSRSEHERYTLLKYWYRWFFERCDSWEGMLGTELAYLFGAIIDDNFVEITKESEIFQLLRKHNVNSSADIWNFIRFSN
jgi:hypothetical protein